MSAVEIRQLQYIYFKGQYYTAIEGIVETDSY